MATDGAIKDSNQKRDTAWRESNTQPHHLAQVALTQRMTSRQQS